MGAQQGLGCSPLHGGLRGCPGPPVTGEPHRTPVSTQHQVACGPSFLWDWGILHALGLFMLTVQQTEEVPQQ